MKLIIQRGECVYAQASDGVVLLDDGASGLACLEEGSNSLDEIESAIAALGRDRTCNEVAALFSGFVKILHSIDE